MIDYGSFRRGLALLCRPSRAISISQEEHFPTAAINSRDSKSAKITILKETGSPQLYIYTL